MLPLFWDRLTVAAGVAYAGLISIPLVIENPDLAMFYVIGLAVVTLPLAFRRPAGFRVASGVAAFLLVPLALFGVFFALHLYLPAMLPLVVAAMPPPKRHQREKFIATGSVLAAALVAFVAFAW
ncbi:hypothetical protein [Dactylosporangium sp. NPDC048998]|uniref:hypothetical protein n=1 Tax=Dactylosporangium sp. NPDC048998 TaxID=3363976 RepID=UPI00372402D9